MSRATADAGPSLALIKYFGKTDDAANLPATPSLGLTVDGLGSTATVEVDPAGGPDGLAVDGLPASGPTLARAVRMWDALRVGSTRPSAFRASVTHRIPAAAGLASSSSTFAALARASAQAAGLALAPADLASVARLGSGSAARACFGGWSALETDGRAFAVATDVRLGLVVLVVEPGPKPVPSAVAMQRARSTSPRYAAWVDDGRRHFDQALRALADGDIERLLVVAEANSRAMHELLAACAPPIDYATDRTRRALQAILQARRDWKFPAAISRDAGANPFVAVEASQAVQVARSLQAAVPFATVRALVSAAPSLDETPSARIL